MLEIIIGIEISNNENTGLGPWKNSLSLNKQWIDYKCQKTVLTSTNFDVIRVLKKKKKWIYLSITRERSNSVVFCSSVTQAESFFYIYSDLSHFLHQIRSWVFQSILEITRVSSVWKREEKNLRWCCFAFLIENSCVSPWMKSIERSISTTLRLDCYVDACQNIRSLSCDRSHYHFYDSSQIDSLINTKIKVDLKFPFLFFFIIEIEKFIIW